MNLENDWTEENVLRLITTVQQYPCIWDPKDKDKKNTSRKREVYRKIATAFEGKSPDDIRKKFSILLQCYRLYRRKVEKSKLLATDKKDIFQPNWFAFKALHEFMENNYTPHAMEDAVIFAHTNGHDIEDVDYQEADQNEFFPEQSCDADEDSKSVPFSIKSKEEDMESKSSGGGKRKSTHRSEEEELRSSDLTYSHTGKKKLEDDKKSKEECDMFAQLLAIKLRKLDERTRICLMNEIDNLVFKTTLRHRFPNQVRLDNVSAFSSPYDDPLSSPTRDHLILQFKSSPK